MSVRRHLYLHEWHAFRNVVGDRVVVRLLAVPVEFPVQLHLLLSQMFHRFHQVAEVKLLFFNHFVKRSVNALKTREVSIKINKFLKLEKIFRIKLKRT